MAGSRITLLSRPGCHLCDDAREVIARVADDLGVTWEERDITQSEADLREYWEKIPVTLVDDAPHDFWRVSEDRLRRALRLPSLGRRSASGVWREIPGQGAGESADFVHLFTNDVWWMGRVLSACLLTNDRGLCPGLARHRAEPSPGASHVQCRRAVRPRS